MIGSFTYLKNRIIVNLEGLTHADGGFLVSTGSAWTIESGATARTSLGVGAGDSPTFTGLDLTGITDGNVPYMSASGFTDSILYYNGTNIGIGIASPARLFHVHNATLPYLHMTTNTSGNTANDGLSIGIDDANHRAFIRHRESQPMSFWTSDMERLIISSGGLFQLGSSCSYAVTPASLFELFDTSPYITLHNSTHEDSDGGRESRLIARGEQTGGEESVLGYMEFAHDGTSDDEKGLWRVLLNDGDDSDAPSITALTLVSSGKATLYGSLDCGADGASQGILTLWDGAGGNTPGNIKIHSPNGTAWYLFVEDDGTVKIHNAAPTQNSDGSAVGGQSD